jgi:hypothetical protein
MYTNKGHQRVNLTEANNVAARINASFFMPPFEDSSPYEGANRIQRVADYVVGLTEIHAAAAKPSTGAGE